jgi:hypothetical protein
MLAGRAPLARFTSFIAAALVTVVYADDPRARRRRPMTPAMLTRIFLALVHEAVDLS